MNIKIRNAKLGDLDFVFSGVMDVFQIEKAVCQDKNAKRKLLRNAIKSNRVRIVSIFSKSIK